MKPVCAVAAVILAAAAGCASPAGSPAPAVAPTVTTQATTPPAAPAPVSTAATVTGKCVTGIEDTTTTEFYSMADILHGDMTALGPGDQLAEAYQLSLTNTSSVTAEVIGFSVAFYSEGQELTSDSEPFGSPTFITAGQTLTWTEDPWGDYSNGQASVGPYAAGETGGINSVATCQLVQWNTG